MRPSLHNDSLTNDPAVCENEQADESFCVVESPLRRGIDATGGKNSIVGGSLVMGLLASTRRLILFGFED